MEEKEVKKGYSVLKIAVASIVVLISLFVFGLMRSNDDTFSYSTGVELKVFRSSLSGNNPDRNYAADNAFGNTLPYAKIENIPDGFLWYYCSCIKEAKDDYLNERARKDGYANLDRAREIDVDTFQNKDTRKWMVYVQCSNHFPNDYKLSASCIFAYEN